MNDYNHFNFKDIEEYLRTEKPPRESFPMFLKYYLSFFTNYERPPGVFDVSGFINTLQAYFLTIKTGKCKSKVLKNHVS